MRIVFILIMVLVHGGAARAQEVRDSAVSGMPVSRSVAIPVGALSAELFEVPAEGHLIVTQTCIEPISSRTRFGRSRFGWIGFGRTGLLPTPSLMASETGPIPLTGTCTTFEPGLLLSPGELLTCEMASASFSSPRCTMTGVHQSHSSHPGPGRGPR